MYRVVKTTDRAMISDIVADRAVPEAMQNDAELWCGSISGALTLEELISAFKKAGFEKVEVLERGAEPWRTVQGIGFWSVTVCASKAAGPVNGLPQLNFDILKVPTKCC